MGGGTRLKLLMKHGYEAILLVVQTRYFAVVVVVVVAAAADFVADVAAAAFVIVFYEIYKIVNCKRGNAAIFNMLIQFFSERLRML